MSLDLGKKTGAISLEKGQRVSIDKTPKITASVSFSSKTDYDVYAIVLFKDGTEKVVSTFGSEAQTEPTPVVAGIKHLGDIQRGGSSDIATETLEIVLSDDIDKIAVVAYSAQSNGTGSFRKYKVSMAVNNHFGTTVTVDADQANSSDTVYTCVPAIISNGADGVVIERVEKYSASDSENRPSFVGQVKKGLFGSGKQQSTGELVMDAGSKNLYK